MRTFPRWKAHHHRKSGQYCARLDADSGLLLGTLTGHTDQVYKAVFSPDGKLIVTASSDATARLFIGDLHDL